MTKKALFSTDDDDDDDKKPILDPNRPQSLQTWPLLLPMHIAEYELSLGTPLYTLEEIAEHFDIEVEDIERYKQQMSFKAEVRAAMAESKDTSSVVRQKAKAQFEHYLDTIIPSWIMDEQWPPSERLKLFQFLAKTAKVVDDPAAKADAKNAATTTAATTLNLYLQQPSGETKQMTGITINQDPEKITDGK